MKKKLILLLSLVVICVLGVPVLASTVTFGDSTFTPDNPQKGIIDPSGDTYCFTYSRNEDFQGVYTDKNNHQLYDFYLVQPITFTTEGTLQITATLRSTPITASGKIQIFTDEECTKPVNYIPQYDVVYYKYEDGELLFANPLVPSVASYKVTPGTYYMKMDSSYLVEWPSGHTRTLKDLPNFTNIVNVNLNFVSTGDRILTPDGVEVGYKNGPVGFTLNVPADGYIQFTSDKPLSLSLYKPYDNNTFNPAGQLNSTNNYSALYPVTKGTYHLNATSQMKANETYKLSYTFMSSLTMEVLGPCNLYPANGDLVYYLTVNPNFDGCLVPEALPGCYATLTLCNSAFTPISSSIAINGSTASKNVQFAVDSVTKTYYIKVSGASSPLKLMNLSYSIHEKSGSKQSKAVKLKRGKTISGFVQDKDKTGDYYKLTLTKKQKVKLTIKGSLISGRVKVKIYTYKKPKKGKKKQVVYLNKELKNGTKSMSFSKTLSKGTYYISITKSKRLTNGTYSIKWRK